MKRFAAIILSAVLLISLCGCSLLEKFLTFPEPPAEPTAPAAPPDVTDSLITPEEIAFSVKDETETLSLGTVLVTITRPVVELDNADAAETINQYYLLLAGKVRDYAEGDVAALGVPYTVTAAYTLSYSSANALSIGWTVNTATETEAPNFSSLSAANFDVKTGKLLTFQSIFGENASAVQELYLEKIRAAVEDSLKNDAYYLDNWADLLRTEFSEERFYLAEDGIVVFYPRESLGTHTEALLGWEELNPYLVAVL